MVLDLGKSSYLTSDSGSVSVRDIILEKMPKTLLLFTTSTLVITFIGLYLGAFVANRVVLCGTDLTLPLQCLVAVSQHGG